MVSDFRPISLIHSFIKLFTKALARRLAPHMNQLVKTNQSAFICGRIFHDNFKAAQLTAKLLHSKKRPSALLKIDISKAFDSVNWTFLWIFWHKWVSPEGGWIGYLWFFLLLAQRLSAMALLVDGFAMLVVSDKGTRCRPYYLCLSRKHSTHSFV